MSDAEQAASGSKRGRRTLRWWLTAYVLLLVASWLVQLLWVWPVGPGGAAVMTPIDGPGGRAKVAYEVTGPDDAPVVVLLHGSPGRKEDFDDLIPLLTDAYRVVAIDMPGFGDSSRLLSDYGIDTQASYVLGVLDELGVERAHVLGFSMGSGVALHLATMAPERIESLTFYGGIGIQEGEGSGDYTFEHIKYAVGYPLVVVAPELVPHFGLLGHVYSRHAFIRNFFDTDQRPLRGMLEELNGTDIPLLLLHGRDDILVPAWAAEEHHDIVKNSALIMFEASHFMLFEDDSAAQLAAHLKPFLEQVESPATQPQRQTIDYSDGPPQRDLMLPFDLQVRRDMSPWLQIGLIIVASYIMEDPTTVFTGLLVADGQLDLTVALIGIFVGIFTGDLALYLLGWFGGKRVLRWKWVRKRMPTRHVDALGLWFDRHGWKAVLASRFIPGTRFPLYVSAGATGRKPGRFAVWTCLAVATWAPVMLLIVVLLGEAASGWVAQRWWALAVLFVAVLMLIHNLPLLFSRTGRAQLVARWTKLRRWEFWPTWAYHGPLMPYITYLAARNKGFTTLLAVNPGIEHSGFCGESKVDILHRLPQDAIAPARAAEDLADFERIVAGDERFNYPVIIKPNAGERGVGLRLARSLDDARDYFETTSGLALVQQYHPGPYEAGVFYYRHPDADNGTIYTITDKVFPVLVGDGRHTIEQLVWRDRRLRMQARIFLTRFGDERDRVLEEGERMPLAVAGNHAQGTMFLDGEHLRTDALEARVDAISKAFDGGFYFGRYDLRYTDPAAFARGEDLTVIELNGVTGQSTNIYDPQLTLWNAYRTLAKQYRIAFEIGRANRDNGAEVPSHLAMWKLIRGYTRQRRGPSVGD